MGQVVVRPRHVPNCGARPVSTSVRGPSGVTNRPEGGHKTFRNVALYGGLPLILMAMANCLVGETRAKEEKRKEQKPVRVKYEYLQRRTKRFPWGDGNKSFFEKD